MMVFFVLLTLGFIFELGKNALTIESRQTSFDAGEVSTPHAFSGKTLTSSMDISSFLPYSLIRPSNIKKFSSLADSEENSLANSKENSLANSEENSLANSEENSFTILVGLGMGSQQERLIPMV
jgi:hypothetical protein